MAFRIRNGDHLAKEVRRIARKQVEGALAVLREGDHADPETVHELRKHCKKLRALLRLVRPALGDVYAVENAHFRDMAQWLSPLRDAHTGWSPTTRCWISIGARCTGDGSRRRGAGWCKPRGVARATRPT